MDEQAIIIIQYVTLLELDIKNEITVKEINDQYRRLAKIYHPDVANSRYNDGKKFKELNNAKTYLIENIEIVNMYISRGFNVNKSYDYYHKAEQKNKDAAEDERKRREEAEKRAEEEEKKRRKEAEKREAEEEKRRRKEAIKKEAEEKRKRRLEEERRIAEEKRKRHLEEERRIAEEKERHYEENKKRRKLEKDEIRLSIEQMLKNINKSAYKETDYNNIYNQINHFLKNIDYIYNYNEEYKILLTNIKSIKTINYYERRKKSIKKIIVFLPIYVSLIFLCIILFSTIIPTIKYNKAINFIETSEYSKAEKILTDLGTFKDSKIQKELIEVYKMLKNNQYREAVYTIQQKKGEIIIEYDVNGGRLVSKEESLEENIFKKCNKQGYEFINYTVKEYYIKTEQTLALYLTLKAEYKIINYNIKYNLNGGTMTQKNPDKYNIDSPNIVLLNPEKEGFTFIGWFNDDKMITLIEHGTHGDLILDAVYERNS